MPCHVVRESPRVGGKIRTANRETPRGSRKKPNLGRSSRGRRETANVKSHIQGGSNMTGTNCDLFTHNESRSYLNHLVQCRALPWPWEFAFRTAWSQHSMACEDQTRPRCVIQMRKTQSKSLATRHGRGTVWYVWVSVKWYNYLRVIMIHCLTTSNYCSI
jgi:hypothetical protein